MSLRLAVLDQSDADFDEVADDLLDVAPDIADLGEFGRLDLEEGRARELGEAARDFGLAAAGRADHQDVLRHHLFAHRRLQLQTAASGCAGRWRRRAWRRVCPTMKRSSSETISRGENSVMGRLTFGSQAFDDEVVVGVDADLGGDRHRPAHDRLGVEIGRQQRPRRPPARNCRPSRCPSPSRSRRPPARARRRSRSG